jgi:hypothetical protein
MNVDPGHTELSAGFSWHSRRTSRVNEVTASDDVKYAKVRVPDDPGSPSVP